MGEGNYQQKEAATKNQAHACRTDWYSSILINRGSLWNEQNETESYKAILLERNDQ